MEVLLGQKELHESWVMRNWVASEFCKPSVCDLTAAVMKKKTCTIARLLAEVAGEGTTVDIQVSHTTYVVEGGSWSELPISNLCISDDSLWVEFDDEKGLAQNISHSWNNLKKRVSDADNYFGQDQTDLSCVCLVDHDRI